jgi:hypothetical protein
MPPRFTRQSQGALLRKSAHPLSAYVYGAITLYGGAFQNTSTSPRRGRPTPYTTSASTLRRGVRFGLFPFRSPLLRKSLLVSPPPPTEMFQFGGFPLLSEHRPKPVGSPIRASSDQRLHAPTRGLSQLATPFFGTQAKPSTRQRSISAIPGPTAGVGGLCTASSRLTPDPGGAPARPSSLTAHIRDCIWL